MLRCSPKKDDRRITLGDDVDCFVVLFEIPFTFASRDGFAKVNQKSLRSTGMPDRYLDFGLVWELDFHRAFLGINNVLYRVDDRYARNRRTLRAASFLALLILETLWDSLGETHPNQFLS